MSSSSNPYLRIIKHLDNLVKSRFIEMFTEVIKSGKPVSIGSISELCTVGIANSATHAYRESGVVMLRNQNIKENCLDDSDLVYIDESFASKYSSKKLKENDIIIMRTGYAGQACLVPKKYEGSQTFTTLILRLKENADVTPFFVCRYINSIYGKKYVNTGKVGSSQENFGAKVLEKMPIVVPPKHLQLSFESFCQQVDKSKVIAQKAAEKYEILVKSRFIEMFDNEKWPVKTMESLILPGFGLPYGIVQPGDEYEHGVPIIRPVDVLNGSADINELKHTDPSISAAYKRTILTGNEVLITVRATIGRTMVTDERYAGMNVTRGIAVIRQDSNQINPYYLNAFLNSTKAQDYIQRNAKGATLKGLNLDLLRKMNVTVPPMDEQKKFVEFTKQVDKSKIIDVE